MSSYHCHPSHTNSTDAHAHAPHSLLTDARDATSCGLTVFLVLVAVLLRVVRRRLSLCMCSLTRKLVNQPIIYLQHLLMSVQPYDSIRDVMETFDLSLSVRFLRCPYLNNRIQGINDINQWIDWAQRKVEWHRKNKSSGGVFGYAVNVMMAGAVGAGPVGLREEQPPEYSKIWLTPEVAAKWVLDNRILDDLFEPKGTHPELIKRSYPILKLLHDQNLLDPKFLEAAWNLAAEDKHEAQKHLIYDIVGRLSEHLPRGALKALWKLVERKPVVDWDVQFVGLVRDMTNHAFKAYGADPIDQWFGLDLLWTAVSDQYKSTPRPTYEQRTHTRHLKRFTAQLPFRLAGR
jgi:hypothetical protein